MFHVSRQMWYRAAWDGHWTNCTHASCIMGNQIIWVKKHLNCQVHHHAFSDRRIAIKILEDGQDLQLVLKTSQISPSSPFRYMKIPTSFETTTFLHSLVMVIYLDKCRNHRITQVTLPIYTRTLRTAAFQGLETAIRKGLLLLSVQLHCPVYLIRWVSSLRPPTLTSIQVIFVPAAKIITARHECALLADGVVIEAFEVADATNDSLLYVTILMFD